MKKILLPIDFSIYSKNALQTATFLAKQKNAEIIVTYIPTLSCETSYAKSIDVKLAEKKINRFLELENISDVKMTPIIKPFKAFSELDEFAK